MQLSNGTQSKRAERITTTYRMCLALMREQRSLLSVFQCELIACVMCSSKNIQKYVGLDQNGEEHQSLARQSFMLNLEGT